MTAVNYIPRPPVPWSNKYPWWKTQTVFIYPPMTIVMRCGGL